MRWSRPRSVRAITVLPSRSVLRCVACRRTSSTQSAMAFSPWDTDSMSTSVRVSTTGSTSTSGVSGFAMGRTLPAPCEPAGPSRAGGRPRRPVSRRRSPARRARRGATARRFSRAETTSVTDKGFSKVRGVRTPISTSAAWGIGLATVTAEGQVLDAWYPAGFLGLGGQPAEPPRLPAGLTGPKSLAGLSVVEVQTAITSLADPIKDTSDAYLRLHLLSHRLVRPNELNVDGIFGMLANVAWTSAGPCPPDRVDELRFSERAAGRQLTVFGVDKFPRMTDYVVPSGVRIADADRVRLGAHLASGTTV